MITGIGLVGESHVGKAAGLVYSDWIDSFVAVSIRKVSSLHEKKAETAWEWVSGLLGTGGEMI